MEGQHAGPSQTKKSQDPRGWAGLACITGGVVVVEGGAGEARTQSKPPVAEWHGKNGAVELGKYG